MFVTFDQNNSGGYFIQNDDVDEYVIIEGNSPKEILDKADTIFDNYREYCSCCGARWSDLWMDENDIEMDQQPLIFGKSVFDFHGGFEKNAKAIIYKSNGEKISVDISCK